MFSVTDAKRLKDTGFAIQDATVNGYFTEDGIAINISSSKALITIVGHELTHALEGSELYDALKDVVVEYAKSTGDYNSHIAALKQIYSGKKGYETDLDAKAERELVADLCGDYLFSDTDFISRLSVKNRNLFQKIYDEVKYLAKLATSGSKEARQLEKVKHLFEQVYRDTKNTAQQADGVKYSINPKFYDQIDNWDGKTIGFSFVVGETSEALQKAGIPQKQIRWDASKIVKILEKHNGMTLDAVREIPELLEKPVIVIDSKKGKNAKIVMGDLHDEHGNMVTAVLLLTPTSNKGNVLDIIKISSAEGRSHIKSLFAYEDGTPVAIRYMDKNRIQSWLNVNRLQLPLHNLDLDSNNNIDETTRNVNAKLSLSENSEGNVPAGDQTYGRDVEIDLYDDPEAEEAWDADTDGETDVQGIDAEIEQHLATSLETSQKMDAAAVAGDMEQYRTYKAMYNSLEERIRFLYQQKADVNAKLGKAFTNAPAEAAQPVRSVAPNGEMFNIADVKKETEPTPAGESPQNGSLATPISSVFLDIIAETEPDINQLHAVIKLTSVLFSCSICFVTSCMGCDCSRQ